MLTERTLEFTTHSLRVVTGPAAGPPLLFLHGVFRRGLDFLPLIPALGQRWQVHALDFRGHGGSDRRPGQYHVRDYAADALDVLRTFREPAVVFGHSLGALAAMAAAAAEPNRVRAVILEDPPAAALVANLRQTPFFAQFQQMQRLAGDTRSAADVARDLAAIELPAADGRTVRLGELRDAAALRFMARCLKAVDPDVPAPLLAGRWLDGLDFDAVAAGVLCPGLLLRGAESLGGMLDRAAAEGWAGRMADCTLIDFPAAGHLLHWLDTQRVVNLALGFLESLR